MQATCVVDLPSGHSGNKRLLGRRLSLDNRGNMKILEVIHASQAMVCGLQKEEGFARGLAQRLTEVSLALQRRCVASKTVRPVKKPVSVASSVASSLQQRGNVLLA